MHSWVLQALLLSKQLKAEPHITFNAKIILNSGVSPFPDAVARVSFSSLLKMPLWIDFHPWLRFCRALFLGRCSFAVCLAVIKQALSFLSLRYIVLGNISELGRGL